MDKRVSMEKCLQELAQAIDDGTKHEDVRTSMKKVRNKRSTKDYKNDQGKDELERRYGLLKALNTSFIYFEASMQRCLTKPAEFLLLEGLQGQPATLLDNLSKKYVSIVGGAHELAKLDKKLAFPKRTSKCHTLLEQAEAKLRNVYRFERIKFDALDVKLKEYRDFIGHAKNGEATASTSKTLAPPHQMSQVLPSSSGGAHAPQGFRTYAGRDQQVS